MPNVNEGSSSFLTLAFKDQNGAAVIPASARYRLDVGDVEKKEWTTFIPAAATHILTVTPSENSLPGTMRCTFEFTYDTDKVGTGEDTYTIVGLTRYP